MFNPVGRGGLSSDAFFMCMRVVHTEKGDIKFSGILGFERELAEWRTSLLFSEPRVYA